MYYNFNKDIADGDEGEKRVAELLCEKCDGIVSVEHNNDNKYDWKIVLDDGNFVTVEVKHDLRVGDTGNFALETKCRGKDSGVVVTQSDLFVIYCHINEKEHAFAFRTSFFKQILNDWELSKVKGGDVNRDGEPVTEMVLISRMLIKKRACDIVEKDKIDLKKFAAECRKV